MIAVDTNLLARVLTNDDPVQARRAAKLLKLAPGIQQEVCKFCHF
jgi:predicted nucleic-acid-binding protein